MGFDWGTVASSATGDLIGLGFGIYDRIKENKNTKYQQQLNEQTRNDNLNAFSNTVKDMQSVGMSPLAMQGLNPTGGQNAPTTAVSTPNLGETTNALEGMYSRKQQKELAEKEMEYSLQKLDAEKTKAEADQATANANLQETIRHNKESEEIQRKNGNWMNQLINYGLDYVEKKFLDTPPTEKQIQDVIEKVEKGESLTTTELFKAGGIELARTLKKILNGESTEKETKEVYKLFNTNEISLLERARKKREEKNRSKGNYYEQKKIYEKKKAKEYGYSF